MLRNHKDLLQTLSVLHSLSLKPPLRQSSKAMPRLWLGCYLWSKPRSLLPELGGPSGADEPMCINLCVIQPWERNFGSWLPFSKCFHQDNQFNVLNVSCDLFPPHLSCQEHSLLGTSLSFEGSFLTSMCFKTGRDNLLIEEGKMTRGASQSRMSTKWREALFEAGTSGMVPSPSFMKNVNKTLCIAALWDWYIVCLLYLFHFSAKLLTGCSCKAKVNNLSNKRKWRMSPIKSKAG